VSSARPVKPRRPSTAAARPRAVWIKRGAVALDTATDRVGEVQHVGPPFATGPRAERDRDTVWLRPVGGGLEWESTISDLAPVETGYRGRRDHGLR
jgi:hypothetical protein